MPTPVRQSLTSEEPITAEPAAVRAFEVDGFPCTVHVAGLARSGVGQTPVMELRFQRADGVRRRGLVVATALSDLSDDRLRSVFGRAVAAQAKKPTDT